MEYKFDVPDGDYQVKLLMTEYYWKNAGDRTFDVYIENNKVLSDLDLIQTAGYRNVYEPTFDVHVSDGTLNILLDAKTDLSTLAAIEVLGLQPNPTATPTRTPYPGALAYRVDCASSSDYVDSKGVTWVKDRAYAAGGFGYFGQDDEMVINTHSDLIQNSVDDPVG
jgi:hypothetical protein